MAKSAKTKDEETIGSEDRARGVRAMLAIDDVQAAILMLALGDEAAGEAMKYLSDAELEQLVRLLAGLGKVTGKQKQKAMAECERLQKSDKIPAPAERRDHSDFIFAALSRATGARRAGEICAAQGLPARTRTPKPASKPSKEHQKAKTALKKKLSGLSVSQVSCDELRDVIVGLAETARREGILALEPLLPAGGGDKLLCTGLRLAVDGTEPDRVRRNLKTRLAALLGQQEVVGRMIVEGVLGIQAGDNPRLIEHQLESHYRL
jgi:hypothetical protein